MTPMFEPPSSAVNADRILDWRELAAALWRRRALLAALALGGTLTAGAVALLRGPAYEATAMLAVESERAHIVLSPDPRAGAAVDQLTEQDLHAEVALLKRASLIREVLAAQPGAADEAPAGLAVRVLQTLRSAPDAFYRRLHGLPAPSALDAQVQDVAERLAIEPVDGSNLIQISFRDGTAEGAASFVNALAAQHVLRRAQHNQRSRTRDFFERQRAVLADKRQRAEESLQAFYEREGIDSVAGHPTELRERLGTLAKQLGAARRELAESTARADFLAAELRRLPRGGAPSAAAAPQQTIRSHLVELTLKRNALLAKFAPTSDRVREIDQQIAAAKRLLDREQRIGGGVAANPARDALELELARLRAKVVALKVRVPALEGQIQELSPLAERLERVAPEQDRLVGEVNAAKEALQTYSRKEEEARFADALDESRIVNVAIVEAAALPSTPETAGRLRVVLVGVALALLRDRLAETVASEAELVATTGLPVLARLSR